MTSSMSLAASLVSLRRAAAVQQQRILGSMSNTGTVLIGVNIAGYPSPPRDVAITASQINVNTGIDGKQPSPVAEVTFSMVSPSSSSVLLPVPLNLSRGNLT